MNRPSPFPRAPRRQIGTRRRPLAAALGLLVMMSASGAFAGAPSAAQAAEAERIKREGDTAMVELRYDDALDAYDRAYAVAADPRLLYNRARALAALGRYPEAVEQLEEFHRSAPPALKARVPDLDSLLQEFRQKVSTLEVASSVDGAQVLVRGKLEGTTPLERPLRLNAGSATVEVRADEYEPFRVTIDLPAAGSHRLDAKLVSRDPTGVVVIRSVTGATVWIDGRRLGTVPVEARVAPGPHRVVVRRDGYHDAGTTIVVGRGERKESNVPLAETGPIYSNWWFWTATAAVVAGAVVVGIAATTERSADRGDILPGQISAPLTRF